MSAVVQHLNPLREAGAVGGILLDAAGRLLGHTMPSFFPVASLASAGERIAILLETLSDNFEPVSDVMMAFDGYAVLLRRSPDLIVAVVMAETANREAVKMATNLVFRRLAAEATPVAPALAAALPPAPTSSTRGLIDRLPPPPPTMSPASIAAAPKPQKPQKPQKKKNDIWGD